MTATATDRVLLARQIERARESGDWATVYHFEMRLRGMGDPVRAGSLIYAQVIALRYASARRAIRLCRAYAAEPGSSRRREAECIESVRAHRAAIAKLRGEMV